MCPCPWSYAVGVGDTVPPGPQVRQNLLGWCFSDSGHLPLHLQGTQERRESRENAEPDPWQLPVLLV